MKQRIFHNLHRDEKGAVAILWAAALPVMVGFVGLGTDVGMWYYSKRDLQNITDVAAVAAAYDLSGSNPQSSMMLTAEREFQRNGYAVNGAVNVTVNYPPQSGAYAGSTQSVEVIATQPQNRYFSSLFLGEDPVATVQAVATRQPIGSACVLALSQSANSAVYFQGSSTVDLNGCSVVSNSNTGTAIDIAGSANLEAYSLYTAGDVAQSGSSSLTTTEATVTYGAQVQDPFAGVTIPSFSGCNHNSFNVNNTSTINPGVYCNGMTFKSKAVVTMNPGVYIVDRGDFNANAGATITGNGVTIILTSSTGSNYSTVTINGGATVSLSAMTSGSTEGILFYQSRNAPVTTNQNKFNGDSNTSYTGAIYFPNQEVQFSGNNNTAGGNCTKIVANTITFIGNSYMGNTCPGSVMTIYTQGLVSLVE